MVWRSSGENWAPKAWELMVCSRWPGRHLTEVEDGAGHEAATLRGHSDEILHSGAVLLALRGREALDGLVAIEDASALLRVHVVELGETVAHALLGLRGQFVEAGLILERALLVGEGEVLVALHPLGEVLLILAAGTALGRSPGAGRARG